MPTGLYVHIPFCLRKCTYCDFNSIVAGEPLRHAYLHAVLSELARYRGHRVDTVYVGGGTPTTYAAPLLAELLAAIGAAFDVASGAEVTLEANPGTVALPGLKTLRAAGFGRLSLGVQSFCDDELRLLGRIHTASEAAAAVENARDAGFDNVSVDLIRGLPGQSLQGWLGSVERAIALGPEHISAYGLSLEEGTPLTEQVRSGRLPAPEGSEDPDWVRCTVETLGGAGYARYEISNYCRAGRESRHNLNYWHNGEYIGIGAGAWSYLGGERFRNVADPAQYTSRALEGTELVCERERLCSQEALGETIMLGLRTVAGLDMARLSRRFGVDVAERYSDTIRELVAAGMLVEDGERLRPTAEGMLWHNVVALRFLA